MDFFCCFCSVLRCIAPKCGEQTSYQQGKKRNNCVGKEGYEWRDNHPMHLFGSPFCDVLKNKEQRKVFTGHFWQWPARTLIASKSMDEQASQHTFKSLFYPFDLCLFGSFNGCWNVFHSRRKDGLKFFPLWVILSPRTCLFFLIWVRPKPPQEGCKGRGHTRRNCWDQAQPRAAWC